MRVKHFNTYPHGGAANAAMRIHRGLVDQGVDSEFLFRLNDKAIPDDPRVNQVDFLPNQPRKGLFSSIQSKLDKRRIRKVHRLYDLHLGSRTDNDHEVFSMARLPDLTKVNWSKHAGDLIHLHWLAFMADYESFFASIPDEVPIVWTLHDMSPLTGGCHYSGTCRKYESGCGNCPQVANANAKDVSADSIEAKKKALRFKSIHVVAPGQWLIDLAQKSIVWPEKTNFSMIHYGLDLEIFQPQPKMMARQKLGIQESKVLIGFGADDLSNRRKGFAELVQSLHHLAADCGGKHPTIELAVFGAGDVPETIKENYSVHAFGFVQQSQQLSKIYSACDFVVVPSLEDNQPQVGLEAMACGRPVIGFDAGGIPEYVIPHRTGLLAPSRDTEQLAQKITYLSNNKNAFELMGECAREFVQREFEVNQQSQAYVELYDNILSQNQRKRIAA